MKLWYQLLHGVTSIVAKFVLYLIAMRAQWRAPCASFPVCKWAIHYLVIYVGRLCLMIQILYLQDLSPFPRDLQQSNNYIYTFGIATLVTFQTLGQGVQGDGIGLNTSVVVPIAIEFSIQEWRSCADQYCRRCVLRNVEIGQYLGCGPSCFFFVKHSLVQMWHEGMVCVGRMYLVNFVCSWEKCVYNMLVNCWCCCVEYNIVLRVRCCGLQYYGCSNGIGYLYCSPFWYVTWFGSDHWQKRNYL